MHIEESTAVATRPVWVPPAEGVVVVEHQGTAGFIIEGSLAAEVSGETGWGIQLASNHGAGVDVDWRSELASAGTPSGGSLEAGASFEPAAGATVLLPQPGAAGAPGAVAGPASTRPPAVASPPSAAPPSPIAPPATTRPTPAVPAVPSPAPPSAPAPTRPSLDATFEVPAARPRDGVWSTSGGATSLGALVDGGLQVDGVGVSLAELEALARIDLGGATTSARMTTDGALEAYAELEHDTLARAGGETHVVVRMRGAQAPSASRGPVRVHLVLDRSSSMQRTWPRVIASARALIGRLRPDDQLQIVAYGTDVVEAFPLGRVGDGRAANASLGRIVVGGGTNIEGGLSMAYRAAARSSSQGRGLVLLLSDGVPNHGAFEPSELSALATAARERTACTTGVVGLGTEFDARLLRGIARAGRGGYHVAVNIDGLARELEGELEAYARAAARDVSVSVRLAPGVAVVGDGPWTATGDEVTVAFPQLAAGEERRIVLPVRVSASASAQAIATVQLRYQSRLTAGWVSADRTLSVSRGARTRPSGLALQALLDRSLAAALDRAAQAVRHGDGQAAAAALRAHAEMAEGRVEHHTNEVLQARVRGVQRTARAIASLTPSASHGLRRRVSLGLGQIAARIAL